MNNKTRNLSPSIEDYLETIYLLNDNQDGVRSVDVAAHLSVSRPSVNKALRTLIEEKLVVQEKYSLIYLTNLGQQKAKEILHRHNTIKDFLINILKVSEATAEQEACLIEHAMSNETVSKMSEFLLNEKRKKA